MSDRKNVNKYYPPDWDPSKGSINQYVGSHPLRDRAKKLSQGILVIRFELPYNIWCGGCNSPVGMGVRYNAEKKKVGNYYSTPVYQFRMKCHLCDNYFEIKTDPKNHDYIIVSGARRKEQRWDPHENEQVVPEDKATHKKLTTDPMYKLEHGSDDHKKAKSVVLSLGQIEDKRGEWKDDYIINKIARKKFRDEKIAIKTAQAADRSLLTKSSLEIPLVSESEVDMRLAGLLKYRTTESYEEKQKQKRKEIESRPLFKRNSTPETAASPSCSTDIRKKLGIFLSKKRQNPFDEDTNLKHPRIPHSSHFGIQKRKSIEQALSTENNNTGGLKSSETVQIKNLVESKNSVQNTHSCDSPTDVCSVKIESDAEISERENEERSETVKKSSDGAVCDVRVEAVKPNALSCLVSVYGESDGSSDT